MRGTRLGVIVSIATLWFTVGVVAGPRSANATCPAAPAGPGQCTPQFDALGGVVGCCKADCTWKSGSNTQLECVNPANPCQQGHCWADFGPLHTCQGSKASGGVNFSNTDGHPFCVRSGNACDIGECFAEVCTYIDNSQATGFLDRCEYLNDDQCKIENCQLVGGSFDAVLSCNNPFNETNGTACDDGHADPCEIDTCQAGVCVGNTAPNNTVCGGTGGSVCTPAVCIAGVCYPSQTCTSLSNCPASATACQGGVCIITCTGTLGTCEKHQCNFSGAQAVCTDVADVGKSCDVDPNDCKVQACTARKRCHATQKAPGVKCDTNLQDCDTGVCDSRANCTGLGPDPALQGQVCADGDSNVCSESKCSNQGLCLPDSCRNAQACGCGGHCAGSIGSCVCQ